MHTHAACASTVPLSDLLLDGLYESKLLQPNLFSLPAGSTLCKGRLLVGLIIVCISG